MRVLERVTYSTPRGTCKGECHNGIELGDLQNDVAGLDKPVFFYVLLLLQYRLVKVDQSTTPLRLFATEAGIRLLRGTFRDTGYEAHA